MICPPPPTTTPSPLSPVSKLDRRNTRRLRKRHIMLWRGERQGRTKSYDRKRKPSPLYIIQYSLHGPLSYSDHRSSDRQTGKVTQRNPGTVGEGGGGGGLGRIRSNKPESFAATVSWPPIWNTLFGSFADFLPPPPFHYY